jgi:hypothetical protein
MRIIHVRAIGQVLDMYGRSMRMFVYANFAPLEIVTKSICINNVNKVKHGH